MNSNPSSQQRTPLIGSGLLPLLTLLLLLLLILFRQSFQSGEALFSNDAPLATQIAERNDLPEAFMGIWHESYWVGAHTGNFSPNITSLLLKVLGPYGYNNFHIVASLLILGACAWFFFRRLGFGNIASVLGGLAAALNMNFFSNAAWGLSSRALCLSMVFLALAAIQSSCRGRPVIKTILAGLAIGMSISEGGDNGAIFSLFIAAYAFCMVLFQEKPGVTFMAKALQGAGRVALMAAFAGLMAVHILNLFVDVAVVGVEGAKQDAQTKARQWDFATQWSLPKLETFRVVVPGLFGYRMDTPDGGLYWGGVGRSAAWQPSYGAAGARSSGAGEYAGVLVVLVSFWALAQARRREKSVFSVMERKQIWFWAAAAMVALLFAWGRHAPFYQILYAMPYFSTIRNPMKFMHPFHLCLMILFAFGVEGLCRAYLAKAEDARRSLLDSMKHVWKRGNPFEKGWCLASILVVVVSFLSFLVFFAARGGLVRHLQVVGFSEIEALSIARFSAGEVGYFLLFTLLSAGAVWAVMSGWFAGRRALSAAVMLGTVLVVDLVRADMPWIIYYNYEQRYASNEVIDVLKDDPWEHRVAVMPFGNFPSLANFQQFYHYEWLQHHFQFYGIQSTDVAQEPRRPADKEAYLGAFSGNAKLLARYWQLTNVRYLLGLSDPQFVEAMNQQLTPTAQAFKLDIPFLVEAAPNGHFQIQVTNAGPFGLLEMTNALPRARLYSDWQVLTNDAAVLKRLAAEDFDPQQTVLVDTPIESAPATDTNAAPGTVEITDYTSRLVTMKTQASQPSVLLFNDRWHPSWQVSVDGEPAPMLRCNYIMRGVRVPPGAHEVVWRFTMSSQTFLISFAAVLLGVLLCAWLVVMERRDAARVNV